MAWTRAKQLGDLRVVAEREGAAAGLDALAQPVGARQRVGIGRPRAPGVGIESVAALSAAETSAPTSPARW